MLRWFGTYWPALIILWGVIKLVEYQQAQREGVRPTGIGAGGVLLLIFLIMFGMSATSASRFNWDEIRDHINLGDEDIQLFRTHLQLRRPATAGLSRGLQPCASLNDRGAVNVTVSDDNQIHVVAHKRINADSQAEADKFNPGTKPQITVSDHTRHPDADTPRRRRPLGQHGSGHQRSAESASCDFLAPRRCQRSGPRWRRRNFQPAGDVAASDINGKVSLNLSRGSARVSKVSSDVSVQGRADDISLEDVKGAARLNGEFDTIKLAKIAGAVSFKSARTDMEFSRLDGDLDMDSGDMRATDLTGPFRLLTRSKDVRLAGVNGDVRLQNENGAVEIRMNKLGSMQVSNRNSDIQIYLPDKAAFQVDAHSRGGEIESDFDALKVENGNDQATASGTIGSGGPHLVIIERAWWDRTAQGIVGRRGADATPAAAPAHAAKGPRAHRKLIFKLKGAPSKLRLGGFFLVGFLLLNGA